MTSTTLTRTERYAAHDVQVAARRAGRHEYATRIYTARQVEGFAHAYSAAQVEQAVAFIREAIAD